MKSIAAFCLALNIAAAAPTGHSTNSLPTVDLGYEIHQALVYNDALKFYNFTNIPFAAPPVGELRFAAPQPPLQSKRSVLNNGNVTRICPQAHPNWSAAVNLFANTYAAELIQGNGTANPDVIPVSSAVSPFAYKRNPIESEDCLYLDVIVPQAIFEAGPAAKAPVLVEIFGGGYTFGDKGGLAGTVGPPYGFLQRSSDKIIYVAMNYRLGALGFSAGPTFQASGGVANAGLLDQRAAVEWVKTYISKFGGDSKKITLIGESAGGGSIEHHITAYGGREGCNLFQRAIPQSPAFFPVKSNNYTEQTYLELLHYANVSSLEALRALPTDQLLAANAQQIYNAKVVGTYTYGPVVDGSYVPDLPGNLLANGEFDQSVSILAGHNLREGYTFTPPYVRNDSTIEAQLKQLLPGASSGVLDYIVTVLYPAVFTGVYPYRNWYERAALITTELSFSCNAYYLDSATSDHSYGYLFNIFPAFHGQDVVYTYYAGTPPNATNFAAVQNANTAYTLQDWILNFAISGSPTTSVPGSPNLPVYGSGSQIGILNGAFASFQASIGTDDAANERCKWWQKALYV